MNFPLIASFLLSMSAGILLTFILLPSVTSGTAGLLFRLFAGGGLGVGIASGVYFLCLLAGLTRFVAGADLLACLVLGLGCFMLVRKRGFRRGELTTEINTASRLQRLIAVVFSIELVSSLVSFAVAVLKEPHGRWDAWLIWNMHARFLFRSGAQWRDAFASGLDWSHWDYPLLLPLSITRGWTYMGGEDILLPAVMGFLFTFLILGLLLSALSLLRGRTQGYLAAMILMGTPFFIAMGASQFADIPFAFFILATLVLLFLGSRPVGNHTGALVLAGLAAGLGAWTKNEGLLFLPIAATSLFLATAYRGGWPLSLKRTAGFLAGALPVLLIVVYFKTQLAPANDLVAGFSLVSVSEKLFDISRYEAIARAFLLTGISFTQGLIDVRVGMHFNPGAVNVILLAVYLLIAGVRIDERDKMGLLQTSAVLFLMPVGYFFVYVLTPLDLNYHLMTSLNRLFLQLWPCVVFLIFMIAGPPGLFPADEPKTVSAPPRALPVKGKRQRRIQETK